MKTSFTNVRYFEVSIDLGLGEMETMIEALEKSVDAGTNDWTAQELLKSLKETKADSVRQIQESLKNYA